MFFTGSSIVAQSTFKFVSTLGDGSFTLDTKNLVFTGSNGSAAGYADTLDRLIFQGITYTNLAFSVYNNSFIVGGRDGFQILVDKSPQSSAARLEIDVVGNPSVVSGLSVADLVTALCSFDALNTSSFSTTVLYNNPNPPYRQQLGTVTSFQRESSLVLRNMEVRPNHFGFYVAGNADVTVVVEACTDLTDQSWIPVQTNTLTSDPWYFNDSDWSNYTQRFYRVKTQ